LGARPDNGSRFDRPNRKQLLRRAEGCSIGALNPAETGPAEPG
jgi:hypothetical protein